MALLHRAELKPTKLELLHLWLPTRTWYRGPAAPDLQRVASYRFDDPLNAVGVETMLVRAEGGPLLQAPLTYRAAPLDGGDQWLIGTTEHSVLGRRWVYDGCGDPVYAATVAHAILTGGGQADEMVDMGGRLERREPSMVVRGSGIPDASVPPIATVERVEDGDPTVVHAGGLVLVIARILDDAGPADLDGERLSGTWPGQATPRVLVNAR